MTFWIVTSVMALAVAGLLALVLVRGRAGAADVAPADYDLRVYRDQLKEVDRDLERGVIAPEYPLNFGSYLARPDSVDAIASADLGVAVAWGGAARCRSGCRIGPASRLLVHSQQHRRYHAERDACGEQ